MTISSTSSATGPAIAIGPGSNVLSVLQSTAQSNAQANSQLELNVISNQLQNQLNQKLAAVQDSIDTSSTNVLQSQINGLTSQKTGFSTLETQYGTNANVLADLKNQIQSLLTAASGGDSAGFDNALAAANTDVADLTVVTPNPTFEQDGVYALKTQGLGVNSSSSYDLSTLGGQAAATAAVNAAQIAVANVFTATTANQSLAGQEVTSLQGQISILTTQMQNAQIDQLTQSTNITTTLKTQMKTQLHLIELEFGQGQQVAQNLVQEQGTLQQDLNPGSIFSIIA